MKVEILGYEDYITAEGDTFDILAFKYYTNEKLSSYIIQANLDYVDTLIFEQGISLSIPILNMTEVPESLPPWRKGKHLDSGTFQRGGYYGFHIHQRLLSRYVL